MADSVTEISGWDLGQFPVKNCSFYKISVPQFTVTDRGKNTGWPNHEDFIQLLWHIRCSAEQFAKKKLKKKSLLDSITRATTKMKNHTQKRKPESLAS